MRIRMIHAGALAIAALFVTVPGEAQEKEGRRGGQMMERQIAGMKERLKLTDDQETKVKPILAESAKKMMELRQKGERGQPPSEEMQAAMKKNREETNQKLSEVLSKEQMTEYEKMMSERRRGGPREGKRGNRNQ